MSTEMTNDFEANRAYAHGYVDGFRKEWAFTADGTGETVTCSETCILQVVGSGTFGGGTVTISFSDDDGSTFTALGTLTAAGKLGRIFASQGEQFKAVMAGSTTPSANVKLIRVESNS